MKGTANAADDLADGYREASGFLKKAASDEATKAMLSNVASKEAVAKRKVKLEKFDETEAKRRMDEVGKSSYIAKTEAAADSAGNNISSQLSAFDSMRKDLKPKTGKDPLANWTSRGLPFAKKAKELADQRYGVK